MTGWRYPVDARTAAERLPELRRIAARHAAPGMPDWASLLFEPGAEARLAHAEEPDRAFLLAALALLEGQGAHLGDLPEALLDSYLRGTLGIAPLPATPDRVVVAAAGEAGRVPVTVEAGSLVRGGKDAAGAERRYATSEALTVHGATVLGVRGYRVDSGTTLVDSVTQWNPGDTAVPLLRGGAPAPHVLRFADPVLGFVGGSLTVVVDLATGSPSSLPVEWWHSSPDGEARATATATASGFSVTMTGACVPPDGSTLPWLEARASGTLVDVSALVRPRIGRTSIAVSGRQVAPDRALYNSGALDLNREFEPFGPVPRHGDAFYLVSEEAFSKPVSSLAVDLGLGNSSGTVVPVHYGNGLRDDQLAKIAEIIDEYRYTGALRAQLDITGPVVGPAVNPAANPVAGPGGIPPIEMRTLSALGVGDAAIGQAFDMTNLQALRGAAEPRIIWQRRRSGQWSAVGDRAATDGFGDFAGTAAGTGPLSDAVDLGGLPSRAVRAFLSEGDFGWTDYERSLASFASRVAVALKKGDPLPSPPVAPTPPVLSRAVITYSTPPAPSPHVATRNGWDTGVEDPERGHPFALALDLPADGTGAAAGSAVGSVAVGLSVPEAGLGAALGIHFDVEAAELSDALADGSSRWQRYVHDGWRDLDVVDGTHGLRQSGLLRITTDESWQPASPVAGAGEARWLRLLTDAPDRVGTLRGAAPDAVEAVYRSRAADPDSDPTPAQPVALADIKGLVAPVPGVGKVRGVAVVPGRAPEDAAAFHSRATGVLRHRGRAVAAWDYEQLVRTGFAEVALVRALRHVCGTPDLPGQVTLVVAPWSRSTRPTPTVGLAEHIAEALRPVMPVHAGLEIVAPHYTPVSIAADIELARGVPGMTGRLAVEAALEAWLFPVRGEATVFGRPLYLSRVVAFLESLPQIDHVEHLSMRTDDGPVETVEPETCRGLVASSGAHALVFRERL